MKKLIVLAVFLLAVPNMTMMAQGLPAGLVMTCPTMDGIVLISENGLSIADHRLQLEDIPEDGIATFVDPVNNTRALLDARSDEGLYIEILEGSARMQVVAAREAIAYSFERNGAEPASPPMSARFNSTFSRFTQQQR